MTSTTETTTIKRNGFAAIDAFFEGSDIGNKSNDDKKPVITSKITTGSTNHRRGVGVISSSASSEGNSFVSNSNIHQQGKRILRVGRKRQHDDDEDDGEDYNDKDVSRDDDDEEEDLGRTAIVKSKDEKDVLNPSLLVLQQAKATRKKKVGKKERQRLKKQETENDFPTDNLVDANKDTATTDITAITENEQQEQKNDGDTDVTADMKKPKRKRKKVRSKQKNIRKDHRDVKPSHIRSRPITAETRMKLQSPKIIQS